MSSPPFHGESKHPWVKKPRQGGGHPTIDESGQERMRYKNLTSHAIRLQRELDDDAALLRRCFVSHPARNPGESSTYAAKSLTANHWF